MAEEKQVKTAKTKKAKLPMGQRIAKWFRDYKSEFKKINWPTWRFTQSQAVVVIICMIIIGAVVFVLDTGFNAIFQSLAKLI